MVFRKQVRQPIEEKKNDFWSVWNEAEKSLDKMGDDAQDLI